MKDKQVYAFGALLSRMKYITRWGLMRALRQESLSEHTAEAAIIAHLLALVARNVLGQKNIDPEKLAVAALYHDASEILTGDMPTPVKYKNTALNNAYKALERECAENLANLAPPEMQKELACCMMGDDLSSDEKTILKAADRISALVKCVEEENGGNTEFACAKAQQFKLIAALNCPAADYFLQHFLPCYQKNLDELTE